MKTLHDYLQTFKEGIQRDRVRATLTKRIDADGLTTEEALVERFVRTGGATLSFASMTGKKRDGLRLPLKPHWSIFNDGRGFQLSRTAALYANFLLENKYDFAEIETRVKADYEHEIATHRPASIKHGW